MIEGNVDGVRKVHLAELEALLEGEVASFCDDDVVELIARMSAYYRREIMIGIARSGKILSVGFGDHRTVRVPAPKSDRAMSGVRYVHTHPLGAAQLSPEDYSCLERVRADAMSAISVDADGCTHGCVTAFRTPNGVEECVTDKLSHDDLMRKVLDADKAWKQLPKELRSLERKKERVVLVGVNATKESLAELKELATSAGGEVVGVLTQNLKPNAATVIGSGKLGELAALIQIRNADCVVFDHELGGSQAVRLEDMLGVKVLDRSNLILDIFAARASTMEGKLQVELAQLKYNLPRLIGSGGRMDKLRSGIGMRGPGEKKLETDRRLLRKRIHDLEQDIEKLTRERNLRRNRRGKSAIPTVALVGYTNAGKSTLMRALTGEEIYVADKLFATLDPLTRKVRTEQGTYLLTDTVGFVSKLPHEFIDAFSSTLEEARLADLLLVVTDGSDAEREQKASVVDEVLCHIGADKVRRLSVYNKRDKDGFAAPQDALCISAENGAGMEELKQRVQEILFPRDIYEQSEWNG